jgi:hypothetical protein
MYTPTEVLVFTIQETERTLQSNFHYYFFYKHQVLLLTISCNSQYSTDIDFQHWVAVFFSSLDSRGKYVERVKYGYYSVMMIALTVILFVCPVLTPPPLPYLLQWPRTQIFRL